MHNRSHKKNVVLLSADERRSVQALVDYRKLPIRSLRRLQVLLLADQSEQGEALTDVAIRERTRLSIRTIEWIRSSYCANGITELITWRGNRLLPANPFTTRPPEQKAG